MNWKNKHSQLCVLLSFCLGYLQPTEVKGESPYSLYGVSMLNGDAYCGHQEDCAFAMHSVMKFPQALYVANYLNKKGVTLGDSVLVCKDSLDAEIMEAFNRAYTIDADNRRSAISIGLCSDEFLVKTRHSTGRSKMPSDLSVTNHAAHYLQTLFITVLRLKQMNALLHSLC